MAIKRSFLWRVRRWENWWHEINSVSVHCLRRGDCRPRWRARPLDEGREFAVVWSPSSQARSASMADTRLSIRLDLTSGDRIGPGKIALLEAIQATGSISAAARALGMSYRRAWLLVEQINDSLQQPAVTAATGGRPERRGPPGPQRGHR